MVLPRQGVADVTGFEVSERLDLSGDALSAGFYVLELISRGLAERQAEPGVFDATIKVLKTLVVGAALAPCLRQFELEFLAQLGYGLDFHHDSVSGESINPTGSYYLVEDQGFVAVDPNLTGQSSAQSLSIPGWILLAIAAGDFRDAQVRQVAKRVNQNALTPLIGSEPLISRSMYTGESRG